MQFVIGINDEYIDPNFRTDNIAKAVDYARSLSGPDSDAWKVDIEARRDDDDDTLLVMVVFDEYDDDLDAHLSMSQIRELERMGMDADNARIH